MKHLCILILFLSNTTLFAQVDDFESAIQQNLSQIASTMSTDNWESIGQSFDKISTQYQDNWLAHYYVAYTYMQLAGTYQDQTLPIVAKHLDKAQTAIDQANNLAPNHAEVLILQGFIYVARIWESPYLNGGLYGRKISKLFKQAIEIDPNNPRAYYLKGLLTYHTPRFVGGGKEKAKPWLEKANAQYEAFNFESQIMPYWGQAANEDLLKNCRNNTQNTSGQ